jgi:hypothetical protein
MPACFCLMLREWQIVACAWGLLVQVDGASVSSLRQFKIWLVFEAAVLKNMRTSLHLSLTHSTHEGTRLVHNALLHSLST